MAGTSYGCGRRSHRWPQRKCASGDTLGGMLEPTPFVLDDNTIWPLPLAASDGGGWLLIDAGLDYEEGPGVTSWDVLIEQARAQDIAPEDVRFVVVTHEHIDHAGLAARWAHTGARVVAGRAGIATLTLGSEALERQREPRFDDLRQHGAPDDLIEVWRAGQRPRALRWEACPAEAIVAAEDHDAFRLADGETLSLLMTPGHTPGNLVAYVPETGELFSGDTIIPTTIPTAGLHFPRAVDGNPAAPRWPSLPTYLRSVAALRRLDLTRLYPGHGAVINEPEVYLDRFDQHHARRARQIREALGPGPATAFEVTRAVFRRLPDRRLMQAMTEVIGHLDVLAEAGRASCEMTPNAARAIRWRLLDADQAEARGV